MLIGDLISVLILQLCMTRESIRLDRGSSLFSFSFLINTPPLRGPRVITQLSHYARHSVNFLQLSKKKRERKKKNLDFWSHGKGASLTEAEIFEPF